MAAIRATAVPRLAGILDCNLKVVPREFKDILILGPGRSRAGAVGSRRSFAGRASSIGMPPMSTRALSMFGPMRVP